MQPGLQGECQSGQDTERPRAGENWTERASGQVDGPHPSVKDSISPCRPGDPGNLDVDPGWP